MNINTFKHKNLPQNCPHQKTDNKDLLNCTKGDNHIGLCQNPCPYTQLDTTIDATVKFLVTLAETSNLPVFVAVRKTNGEFTVFSHRFRVTRKNRVAEGVVF